MAIIFIFLPFSLLWFYFLLRSHEWREAFLIAGLIWGLILVGITEGLSLFRALNSTGSMIMWGLATIGLIAILWFQWRAHGSGSLWQPWWDRCEVKLPPLNAIFVIGICLIVLIVGWTAVLAPPNTWDVLTYHLPRVMHWIQAQGVHFYSTTNPKQLYMPPWVEYVMTHFHLLSGGDRWDNLVSWFPFWGCILGVSLLASYFGADRNGQVLAALYCATIPQGLLTASGAKNHYATAFWLVVLVYTLLKFSQRPTILWSLAVGSSLGLAWMTKSVTMIYTVPLLVIFLWPKSHDHWRTGWLCFPVMAGTSLLVNMGHFLRNFSLYRSPWGPDWATEWFTNRIVSVSGVVSNILRNLVLHMVTSYPTINQMLKDGLSFLIQGIGGDINDPRTTLGVFQVPAPSLHEAVAGNPLHLMLWGFSLFWVFRFAGRRTLPGIWKLALSLCLAFLMFCAILKWQLWHTRLHLPLFVLASPVVGVVSAKKWTPVTNAIWGFALCFLAIPIAFANPLRPLAFYGDFNLGRQSRTVLYFAQNPNASVLYPYLARYLARRGCTRIALDTSGNQEAPVYPFMILLRHPLPTTMFQYAPVFNASARYGYPENFNPCALVCFDCSTRTQMWVRRMWPGATVHSFRWIQIFDLPAPDICRVSFGVGWFNTERRRAVRWRWSSGRSYLDVLAPHSGVFKFSGRVRSVIVPNRVTIRINRQPAFKLDFKKSDIIALKHLSFPLHVGLNRIEFVSDRPPVTLSPDPRHLAIAVYDIKIEPISGAACKTNW